VGPRKSFKSLSLHVNRYISGETKLTPVAVSRNTFSASGDGILLDNLFNLVFCHIVGIVAWTMVDAFLSCSQKCIVFVEPVVRTGRFVYVRCLSRI